LHSSGFVARYSPSPQPQLAVAYYTLFFVTYLEVDKSETGEHSLIAPHSMDERFDFEGLYNAMKKK